jgi:hypothetical protein
MRVESRTPTVMSKGISAAIVEFIKVWGLLALVVLVGFIVTYQYVGAPPPKLVRIATGAKNGAYYTFAQEYARLLASDGITLEVVPTAGSVENLELLKKREVSLALIQEACFSSRCGFLRASRAGSNDFCN